MTTALITSGVTERVKPRLFRPHVVFRFESTLAGGGSITTPIYDTVPDGWPLDEVSLGGTQVERVAGKRFTVYIEITSTFGMQLQVFHVRDAGGQGNPAVIYVPSDGGNSCGVFEWESPGRRCQFRLVNTPLGASAGTNSNAYFEVVNEAK